MPWCPQCGAEYREGFTECAKCGVALQAEQPYLAQPNREITIPRFLHRPLGDARRAWGYCVEAARVLRRHPALLVIPLALAVVDTGERAVGVHLTRDWVAKQLEAMRPLSPEPDHSFRESWGHRLALAADTSFGVYGAVGTFSSPIPEVSFDGTRQAIVSAVWHPSDQRAPMTLITVLTLALSLIVALPLASVMHAGYYLLAKRSVEGESFAWSWFRVGVRTYFGRFVLFGALMLAVGMVPFLLMPEGEMSEFVFRLTQVAGYIWSWLVLIALVLLGLTQVAVVSDDRGLWRSMRASARTVVRDAGVAILLLIAAYGVVGILVFPLHLAGTFVWDFASTVAFIESTAISLARNAVEAVIGAWFLLVSFLWYRDASARLALRSFDTSPTPPLESA